MTPIYNKGNLIGNANIIHPLIQTSGCLKKPRNFKSHQAFNLRLCINILALVLVVLSGSLSASGATITSNATGNWNSGGTWVGGVAPGSSDNVIIASGHTVTLTAGFTTSGNLTVTGTLQLAGFSMTSGSLQGTGTIRSSSGTPTLTTGSSNSSTSFSGVIGTGAIALTKNGTGTLTLSGSNTYTGATTIAAGTLKLNNTSALGTTAGATSITSGAVLDLNGINYTSAEGLTIAGTGISSGGCLINSNATAATYAGNITLSTTTPQITASNPITLSGIVSGGNSGSTNSLTIAGNGTLAGALTLSGNNTYTGMTTINAGAVLKIGADNALGAATASSLNNSTKITSGGVLDLNGKTYTANEYFEMDGTGISGSGAVINSSSTTANFACQFDTWYGGTITANNPIILSGMVQFHGGTNNDLTKAGSSTLTLTSSSGLKLNKLFITEGTVVLGIDDAIGTSGQTIISSGAALDLNGHSSSRPLTSVSGTGISSGGAITNSSTTAATCSGAITLASNATIGGTNGTIAITGTITGAGFGLTLAGSTGGSVTNVISGASTTVTKVDAGTWVVSGLNTYTGATTISAGILRATNNTIVASTNGPLGNNVSGLSLNGGTLQSNVTTFSRPITITATNSGLDAYGSARTISSTITLSTAGTFNLNVGGTTAANAEGQDLTLTGVISYSSGTLSLTKIGTSNLIFGSQTITLNNLTISAGSLTATSGSMNLEGNFSNNSTFAHNNGTVSLNGSSAQTIGGTASPVFNILSINNASGITADVEISISTILAFTSGNLTTNANKVTLITGATISGEASGKYVVGTLQTSRVVGTGSTTFGGIGLSMAAGSDDLGTVTVVRSSGAGKAATAGSSQGINRTWNITITGSQPSSGRSVTFSWISDDDNGKNLTAMQLYTRETSSDQWGAVTSPSNVAATRSITYSTTHFSEWTASDDSNVLPVKLLSFVGHRNTNDQVELKWITTMEHNNAGFEVERSVDGKIFEPIDFVEGNGTTNNIKQYSFVDEHAHLKAYYRIKQIDYDDNFEYSKIICVEVSQVNYFSIYPNPVIDQITLVMDNQWTNEEDLLVQVISGDGNNVINYRGTLQEITRALNERLSSMSPGLYTVIIIAENQYYQNKILKK